MKNILNTKLRRQLILVLIDVIVVISVYFFVLMLKYNSIRIIEIISKKIVIDLALNLILVLLIFWSFKLYHSVWNFASIDEVIKIGKAILLIGILEIVYKPIFNIDIIISYYILNLSLIFIAFCFSRMFYRLLRYYKQQQTKILYKKNVMIIGAGRASDILINELLTSSKAPKIVCIIDDNKNKHGKYLHQIPIVGDRNKIVDMVKRYDVDEIIIAIPSASDNDIKDITQICIETDCKLRRLPNIAKMLDDNLESNIREISYNDLLGREPVIVNDKKIQDFIKSKTILVTGGGGSIGSELCRQIAKNNPKKLIILDIYENSTYEIQMELQQMYKKLDLETIIASVRDYDRIKEVFAKYKPDIVYHAAAHKHVPLMESSPNEAIKNNCLGTLNAVKLSDKYNVKKFILISTDKAVRPTNIMGASKRICEMIIQTYNKKSNTEFVAVRFGNVLGSNGSVIPLFLKQIENGGPVTVTDKRITRYFMTISEAVFLVLQAGLYAKGGELFVLDMGNPVKIYDLAVNLIKLKGYIPNKDIKIDIVGLRPGEKLYEELLMNEEGLESTPNKLIHIGKPIDMNDEVFLEKLDNLISAANRNSGNIMDITADICETYIIKKNIDTLCEKEGEYYEDRILTTGHIAS